MPRKKKELNFSFPLSAGRVAPSSSFSDSLRALINGLFGKKRPYQPTREQIADFYLTTREREIAYLAALGFSVREIADALGMNFQTVQIHLRHILSKMELEDARQLREYFMRNPAQDS